MLSAAFQQNNESWLNYCLIDHYSRKSASNRVGIGHIQSSNWCNYSSTCSYDSKNVHIRSQANCAQQRTTNWMKQNDALKHTSWLSNDFKHLLRNMFVVFWSICDWVFASRKHEIAASIVLPSWKENIMNALGCKTHFIQVPESAQKEKGLFF